MTKDSDYVKLMGKYGHPQTLDEPISDTIVKIFKIINFNEISKLFFLIKKQDERFKNDRI